MTLFRNRDRHSESSTFPCPLEKNLAIVSWRSICLTQHTGSHELLETGIHYGGPPSECPCSGLTFAAPCIDSGVTSFARFSSVSPSVPGGLSVRTNHRTCALLSQTRTSTESSSSRPKSRKTARGPPTALPRRARSFNQCVCTP